MCPSGVDEFPYVKEEDLEIAFQRLQNSSTTILVITVSLMTLFDIINASILMVSFTLKLNAVIQ